LAIAVSTGPGATDDAVPLNRYGLEREIADAIVYLCGARASYVTGQTRGAINRIIV
jgi:NAD(P)-dependent dehydrogenase (short-subunit alcohol dehydrogenase family)